MAERPSNAQIAALLGLNRAGPGPSMGPVNVSFPTPRFVPTGSLKPTPKSISGSIQATIARSLNAAGMNEQRANRLASRTMAPLTDVTPVGNVTGAQEGGRQFMSGVSRGDLTAAGLGALAFGLSVAPVPGGAKRAAKKLGTGLFGSMARDTSGAIRAWHGSPHDFDRFEWSPRTRGTGEGAQAYGDGLYFAENKKVAEEYRDELTKNALLVNGVPSSHLNRDTIYGIKGITPAAKEHLAWYVTRGYSPEEALRDAPRHMSARDVSSLDRAIGSGKIAMGDVPGRLYEVNINAEPEEFLDYDAPLARQPAAMEALKHIDLSDTLSRTRKMLEWAREGAEQPHNLATGRELLNAISGYGEKRSGDLMTLQPYGIKGVQFLDQGSRGAGSGTRNFVVPDHRLIDILAKY